MFYSSIFFFFFYFFLFWSFSMKSPLLSYSARRQKKTEKEETDRKRDGKAIYSGQGWTVLKTCPDGKDYCSDIASL